MLENHRPIVRERLLACAVFGAIAVGVVAASDLMVTGGFDFPATARNAHADTPNYFQIAGNEWNSDSWSPRAEVREAAWIEPAPQEAEFTSYEPQDLAGDVNSADAQVSAYQGPSGEELRREIEAMYAELPSADADYETYSDESYASDEYADADGYAADEKEASAYGSASPW